MGEILCWAEGVSDSRVRSECYCSSGRMRRCWERSSGAEEPRRRGKKSWIHSIDQLLYSWKVYSELRNAHRGTPESCCCISSRDEMISVKEVFESLLEMID